jgi:hypothetical protein
MTPPLLLPTRRDLLRVGTVAVTGLGGSALAANRRPPAKAVILLFMDGGTSHIDLFDLKPSAPAEVRGPFQPIATTVPGVPVCEHLPHLATRMHRVLQLRSVRHTDAIHDPAVYLTLTGKRHPTPLGGLRVSPDDAPHVGGLYSALASGDRRVAGSMLSRQWFELPETMKMEARTLPGQNGGFLGKPADPFRVEVTPDGEVVPPDFGLPAGVTADRLLLRGNLRDALDRKLRAAESAGSFDASRRQAVGLLASSQFRTAFDLTAEPEALRDKYGRYRHGQSVLLARRLVEAGARFVTVYWGREEQDWADGVKGRFANNPWDTHRNHFPLVKDSLLPRADRTLAALLDDLADRGLLDDVLVVWMGEFGRTPVITKPWASRDHWPQANTILLAGGGVAGGHVLGRTDGKAAEVTDLPVTPADVVATMLAALGANPRGKAQDRQGRPLPACDGTPIEQIYTG